MQLGELSYKPPLYFLNLFTLSMGLIRLSQSNKGSCSLAEKREFGSQVWQHGRQKPWPHQQKGLVQSGSQEAIPWVRITVQINRQSQAPAWLQSSSMQSWIEPNVKDWAKCESLYLMQLPVREVEIPPAVSFSSSSKNCKISGGFSNRSHLSEISSQDEGGKFS